MDVNVTLEIIGGDDNENPILCVFGTLLFRVAETFRKKTPILRCSFCVGENIGACVAQLSDSQGCAIDGLSPVSGIAVGST